MLYFLLDHPVHSVYLTNNLYIDMPNTALSTQWCSQRQRGEANQAMPLI